MNNSERLSERLSEFFEKEYVLKHKIKTKKRREAYRCYYYQACGIALDHNNDCSRPGRYIMPRKHQGTIIPAMNINRYYPYPSLKLPHFERKKITPFDVNHKNREHHHIATLGSAPFSCAKLRIILQII